MRLSRLLIGAAGLSTSLWAFAMVPVVPVLAASPPAGGQSVCIAHHPQEFVWYTHSCT